MTDVLIFSGQSNMQGQTECLPLPNDPVENATEYRFLSHSLVPLCHPVGEAVGEDLLLGAHLGNGSLLPDFCREYTARTGRKAVAIHVAKGATTVAQWQPDTERYAAAVKKIQSGIELARKTDSIGRIFFIWLQGESDGIEATPSHEYARLLTALKNSLKKDVGTDRFCIIKVGFFISLLPDLTPEQAKYNRACDLAIMDAQEELVSSDGDFAMICRICPDICQDPQYINPEAMGHYNNEAMKLIGKTAARALAEL